MGQITATRNLVAIKVVRHAGQWTGNLKHVSSWNNTHMMHLTPKLFFFLNEDKLRTPENNDTLSNESILDWHFKIYMIVISAAALLLFLIFFVCMSTLSLWFEMSTQLLPFSSFCGDTCGLIRYKSAPISGWLVGNWLATIIVASTIPPTIMTIGHL